MAEEDSTRSLFSSARSFFGGTMISRITGMVRDILLAATFGTSSALAAFMVAFRFAHLLRRLFGEGALQMAFVPQFEKMRQKDGQQAGEFFVDLRTTITVVLLLIILIISSILGGLLYWGNLDPGNQEIALLTLLMLPSLLFICLFGLNASLLQCEKYYFLPSVASALFNGVWIVTVVCLWPLPPPVAMQWMAGGIVLACLAQWCVTVPKTRETLQAFQVGRSWSSLKQALSGATALGGPMALGIIGIAATQVNNALDVVFARIASLEGPALIWYAVRLQQLPLAVFGIAIAGALLPPLSRAVKEGDRSKSLHFLSFALNRNLLIMVPIVIALSILGDSAVNLVYGRGHFTDQSVVGTTLCLWGYGVGLVPMTLVLIFASSYYAHHQYRIPTLASVLAVGVNIVLNTVFVVGFHLGPESVALATSLSAWVQLFVLLGGLYRYPGRLPKLRPFWDYLMRLLVAAAASAICVALLDISFSGQPTIWQLIQGEIPVYPTALTAQLATFSFQAGIYLLLFTLGCRLLGVKIRA